MFKKIYTHLCFLLIVLGGSTVPTASAQLSELAVIPIEVEQRGGVVNRQYADKATVIVTSSLRGLRIGSNIGVVDTGSDSRRGEYTAVLSPGRQTLTFDAPGHRTARVSLQRVAATDVFRFSVETLITSKEVQFQLSPSRSTLYVDGVEVPRSRLRATVDFGATVNLRAVAEGHIPYVGDIIVDESSADRLLVSLVPLGVQARGQDLDIVLNGVERIGNRVSLGFDLDAPEAMYEVTLVATALNGDLSNVDLIGTSTDLRPGRGYSLSFQMTPELDMSSAMTLVVARSGSVSLAEDPLPQVKKRGRGLKLIGTALVLGGAAAYYYLYAQESPQPLPIPPGRP